MRIGSRALNPNKDIIISSTKETLGKAKESAHAQGLKTNFRVKSLSVQTALDPAAQVDRNFASLKGYTFNMKYQRASNGVPCSKVCPT